MKTALLNLLGFALILSTSSFQTKEKPFCEGIKEVYSLVSENKLDKLKGKPSEKTFPYWWEWKANIIIEGTVENTIVQTKDSDGENFKPQFYGILYGKTDNLSSSEKQKIAKAWADKISNCLGIKMIEDLEVDDTYSYAGKNVTVLVKYDTKVELHIYYWQK